MTRLIDMRLLERTRELAWDLRQQDQEQSERARRTEMTHKRTKYGLAKRPPALDDLGSSLDGWQEEINAALDATREVAEREATLERASQVDRRRFPMSPDGQR